MMGGIEVVRQSTGAPELAEVEFGGFDVGGMGGLGGSVSSKRMLRTPRRKFRVIPPMSAVDSFWKPRLFCADGAAVGSVIGAVGWTDIAPRIVEAVMVFVVNKAWRRPGHPNGNYPMLKVGAAVDADSPIRHGSSVRLGAGTFPGIFGVPRSLVRRGRKMREWPGAPCQKAAYGIISKEIAQVAL